MILGVDIGTADLGWAVVEPHTGRLAALGHLHQDPIDGLPTAICRATRSRRAGELLSDVVRRHRCTAIAAEALSTAAGRFTMAISVGLSFGMVSGVAAALDLMLYAVPPKV